MKKLILISILFAAITACKKDPPPPEPEQLPPLTHEGLNTFGCKVNGEIWVAKAPFSVGGPVPLDGNYDESTGDFWIKGTKKIQEENIYEFIKFYGVNIQGSSAYEMSVLNDAISGFGDIKNNYSCGVYYHDTLNKGELNITYINYEEDIISGTFNMILINNECDDSVMYVTDGRFDLKY